MIILCIVYSHLLTTTDDWGGGGETTNRETHMRNITIAFLPLKLHLINLPFTFTKL